MAAGTNANIDWEWLMNEYPNVYKQRAKIVEQRINEKLIIYGDECRIIKMVGDGNCMINSCLVTINDPK